MPVKIKKEEVERILKIKGNVSGAIFGAYRGYLIANKGKDIVKQIEWRLENLGLAIKLKTFSSFKMYPEAWACLICLVILENFGWELNRAFDIGYEAPMYSIVTKLFMKYVSIEKMLVEGPKHWRRHFDFGKMKCTKKDIKRGYAILRLNGFKKFHQTVYIYILGYLTKLIEMVTSSKKVKVEQTKSLYNNDSYDEFKITWK